MKAEEFTKVGIELQTVGFVVKEDDTGIIVALEKCTEDDNYRQICSIPAPYILSKQYFEIDENLNLKKLPKSKKLK
jgi:hypothetical protein